MKLIALVLIVPKVVKECLYFKTELGGTAGL